MLSSLDIVFVCGSPLRNIGGDIFMLFGTTFLRFEGFIVKIRRDISYFLQNFAIYEHDIFHSPEKE